MNNSTTLTKYLLNKNFDISITILIAILSILICLPFLIYCIIALIFPLVIYIITYMKLKKRTEYNNSKIIIIHNLLFSSTSGPVLKEIIIN